MKVIIDIPDEQYEFIRRSDENAFAIVSSKECMLYAIKNGTPLPKGHGDLIDRNILLQNWKVIPSRDRLIFDRYIQTLNGVIPADK
jgi:hypothetical protein